MTTPTAKLAELRRDVRHPVAMRAQISIASAQATVVRLSAASGVKDGWLEADAVDLSLGGVGIISLVFFPRQTLLRVRLLTTGEAAQLLFEGNALVRRVVMTDRRPAYQIGAAFQDLDATALKQAAVLNGALTEGV